MKKPAENDNSEANIDTFDKILSTQVLQNGK